MESTQPKKRGRKPLIKNKKLKEEQSKEVVEKKQEKHPIEIAVSYIEEHMGPHEKDWTAIKIKQKGWTAKYYIYKAIKDFFELPDDPSFDGSSLR